MKKVIITLLLLTVFIFSFIPAMLGASYIFGGREAFMKFVTETADGRFWMLGIPLFIMTFAGTCGILFYIFYYAFGSMKPKKKIYYLKEEDGTRSEVFDMEGNKVEFMNLGKKDSI
jgi:hypothetical protein